MKKLFSKFNLIIPCIFIFIFFLPNLIQGKIPIPADSIIGLYHPWRDISYNGYNPGRFPVKNPLITDPVIQTYPWKNLVINNIKGGNLPLWNPYNFSGQPLLANIQSSPLQIMNILYYVFPFKVTWSIQVILPMLLLGVFMYLFLKSLKLSLTASIFGAFVLPFSGFIISWFTWGTVITTAMWLPLILYCINRIFNKLGAVFFPILTFAIFQTIVSGHWQTALYVIVVSFLYLLFKFITDKSIPVLISIVIGMALGVLIAMPQILPSLEFISLSNRVIDQGYTQGRLDWFLPPQNLIQLIAPDFFGNPTTYNYWGIWNYAEFVSYIGIIPLFFVIFGLSFKNKKQLFFLLLAIFSLLLALPNFISKIPYSLNIFAISNMQPSRILFIFIFSLIVISSFGLDKFIKINEKKKLFIPAIFIILILISLLLLTKISSDLFPNVENLQDSSRIAFRNLILPIIISLSLLLLVALKVINIPIKLLIIIIFTITTFDLFRFANKFTPFSKLSWIFPQTSITEYLSNQAKPFRTLMTDRRIFNGNTSSFYQLETVQGYDPLFLKDYAKLVSSWESNQVTSARSFNRIVTPQNYDSQITDLLNVKYILSFDEISNPRFTKVYQEGITKIYQNNNALPRAFFVKEVVQLKTPDNVINMLLNEDSNLITTAYATTFKFPRQESISTIYITKYSDQSITINTQSDKDAPLILSNIYYPGWKAYIDRVPTEIKKADFILQSVIVPAGKHQVEFKFQPASFYNGLYLSLVGIVLTILFSLFLWRKKFQ